jgi:hypothetical protein
MSTFAGLLLENFLGQMLRGEDWVPRDRFGGQIMDQFAMPDCTLSADPEGFGVSEVSNTIAFGRFPNLAPYDGSGKYFQSSLFFPRGMATEALFPDVSSTYTDPDTGTQYESPCYKPKANTSTEAVLCPFPFVKPQTDKFIGKVNCIKPCPVQVLSARGFASLPLPLPLPSHLCVLPCRLVSYPVGLLCPVWVALIDALSLSLSLSVGYIYLYQAYTDEEYHTMWVVSSVPAVLGFVFNIFMATTWFLEGRHAFKSVSFNLKMCVGCGLLYGIIDTIPVLVLGDELPW